MQLPKPRFTHDCNTCHFLGQHEDFDLYVCDGHTEVGCIARYGDEEHEYKAIDYDSSKRIAFKFPDSPYREIIDRMTALKMTPA